MISRPVKYATRNRESNPKQEQQAPHQHVGQKRSLERIFRSPGDHEGMQTLALIEFVVLQGVDNIESDEPEHDGHAKRSTPTQSRTG